MRIRLSYDEFQCILANLFDIKAFPDAWLRVEKALKKDIQSVQAIRIYLPELMKEIDQTVERKETPRLLIKRTLRQKTGKPEVELVFLGSTKERHVEDLDYYRKHPKDWTTWGLIALTLEQTEALIKVLQEMVGITTLD